MQLTYQEILNFLRREKPFLQREFGLLSIGVFGSYVKGTQGSKSDIDLLVEFAEPRFDSLAGLQIYLERKFGRRVELIRRRKSLSERFIKRIEEDIRYA